MKGKIILRLGAIISVLPAASVVACGNKNQPQQNEVNVNKTGESVNKQMSKYPKLTEGIVDTMTDGLRQFVLNKTTSYFDKYISHFKFEPRKTISDDGNYFLYCCWSKSEGVNGSLVLNYHEAYDWLHVHRNHANNYPYLNQ